MTTIITRLYPNTAAAQAVVNALLESGHDQSTIDVIARDGVSDVMDRMRHARVGPAAAAAYADHIGTGRALLVVRAGFNPVGAARNAVKVTAKYPSIDVGLHDENEYIREDPDPAKRNSVLRGHPLFMSNPHRPSIHGHMLGSNPILPPREKRSAIAGGAFMSGKVWPMRLVSQTAKEGTSAIRGGGLLLTTLIGSNRRD
jgi:hypothetical protein